MSKRRDGVRTIQEKNRSPQFTLRDAAGKEHSLAEALRKGPVVAAFFKVSCPVCQFTFPFLERLYKLSGDSASGDSASGKSAATFLAISQDDARDTREFCAEYGITFPALIDAESYDVSNAYGITNVPSVFLISPDGTVKLTSIGFDKAKLEAMAAELASGTKRSSAPLFRPGEVVPSFKPG
ncbi:MAG: TlpA disulfide reductase family protein [Candidatus Acidiferrales bacterium]